MGENGVKTTNDNKGERNQYEKWRATNTVGQEIISTTITTTTTHTQHTHTHIDRASLTAIKENTKNEA